ncbi:MAG TPA: cysteine desulfurase [Firmicutes bacterium]|nr:cysteine desulfurase [Candidatus Fermentithermobacillaceae bacterium]
MDNSSTTRPAPEVVKAVTSAMEEGWGNPSSLHKLGSKSQAIVRAARQAVARAISADESEVYFTSGGTEANNLAIFGTLRTLPDRKRIITSTVEHPSVMAAYEYLKETGYDVRFIRVDSLGRVDPEEVLREVTPDTALVSIMLVQNEIGTLQPCREIGRGLMSMGGKRPRFHIDAVQGFARLSIDVREWGVDLLSVSAHKIHGPKGVGALYVRKGVSLTPLAFGGGQEKGVRSGTENVPGIAGFGAACALWETDREETMRRLTDLRAKLVDGILGAVPDAVLHGPRREGVAPYIVHFSFPGLRGETILHALEERGVYVSTGSACSSHKDKPSPVVLALGRKEEEALGAIRFSMSRYTTEDDVRITIAALLESLQSLKAWRR